MAGSPRSDAVAGQRVLAAIDALEGEERLALQRHLAACARCRGALRRMRASVADAAPSLGDQPPESGNASYR